MPLPLDFLDSIKTISLEELIHINEIAEEKRLIRSFFQLRNEIKPIDLFCYLGSRFGPPNGIQNFLRSNSSDNLVHWDWVLKYQETYIGFWGANFSTDCWVISGSPFTNEDQESLINNIQVDLKFHTKKMKFIRGKLEKWTEFVNPYWRLRKAIYSLKEDLAQINLTSKFSESFNTPATIIDQSDAWDKVSDNFNKAFGLCFGIRAMVPVWAEAFINLIIYIQARPEIKSDSRLLDGIFRQNIDLRVKLLHVNCVGFEKPVDFSSNQCKKFNTLINQRNDILHGNVVPQKNKFNEVYFLQKIPVFNEYLSLWDRTVAVSNKAAGLEKVDSEITIVVEFVEYVLSCMKPDTGNFMRNVLQKRDLGEKIDDKRFGILFPDHLVDSKFPLSSE